MKGVKNQCYSAFKESFPQTIKPTNYLGALLLQLRVKTDDGHRVAVSGVEQSGHIIFPVLAYQQQDIYTLIPGPSYHLYRQVFG